MTKGWSHFSAPSSPHASTDRPECKRLCRWLISSTTARSISGVCSEDLNSVSRVNLVIESLNCAGLFRRAAGRARALVSYRIFNDAAAGDLAPLSPGTSTTRWTSPRCNSDRHLDGDRDCARSRPPAAMPAIRSRLIFVTRSERRRTAALRRTRRTLSRHGAQHRRHARGGGSTPSRARFVRRVDKREGSDPGGSDGGAARAVPDGSAV